MIYGMPSRSLCHSLLVLLPLASLSACAVDFDGYVFDDDELAKEEGGDGDNAPSPSAECETFCDDEEEFCGFGKDISYESRENCLELCAGYFESELSCRVTHLGYAASGSSDSINTHCPHTLEDGGNTCPDAGSFSCDRFCLRADEACPFDEADDVFANSAACRSACADMSEGGIECRFVELSKAEKGDISTCANLLEDGGDPCAGK